MLLIDHSGGYCTGDSDSVERIRAKVDVFTTVVGIVVAGIALFVGYRVGIKDGFRGGFQSGRAVERRLAVEERRFLTARVVRAEGLLNAVKQKALASRSGIGDLVEDEDGREFVDVERPGGLGAIHLESYQESQR